MVDYCIICGHGGNDTRMANEREMPGSTSFPMCAKCRAHRSAQRELDGDKREADQNWKLRCSAVCPTCGKTCGLDIPHGEYHQCLTNTRLCSSEWKEVTGLKPCPFCGSREVVLANLGDDDDYFVSCKKCEVQQIANYTRDEAARRWNQRSGPKFGYS